MPAPLAKAGDERGAYDAAFDALKAGDYAESAQLFQTFPASCTRTAPTRPTRCTGSARATTSPRTTQLAQQQFQALLDRYPTHDKAPGALLKVGLSQYGLKQVDAAERTLERGRRRRYPGTDAARTADDRLRDPARQLR